METDFLLELLTYDDPTTGRKRTAGLASLSDELQQLTELHSCIPLCKIQPTFLAVMVKL